MNTLLSLILTFINGTMHEDINYEIALQLIQSYQSLDELSASSLAAKSRVSVSSITKFCKMFGISNFSSFQFLLLKHRQIRKEQFLFRIHHIKEIDIMNNIKKLSICDFDENAFQESIKDVIELMNQVDQIYFIGATFPNALTLNFQEDMMLMGKTCYSRPIKNTIHIPNVQEKTLFFIISLTGRIHAYNKTSFYNIMNANSGHLVMLTGNNVFPQLEDIKIIKVPIDCDDEVGNLLILEILRYIKYKYFMMYIGDFRDVHIS